MATSKVTEKEVVMTFIERRLAKLFDKLPTVSKKTMRLSTYKPIDQFGEALVADFKMLADQLVNEVQICDNCGNEIHFERYNLYPWAKIDLPEDVWGKTVKYEQVWQYKPENEEDTL